MNLIAEDASPSREEVYQALVRSLRRRKGFGIVFVQCSPAEAARLMREIQTDLPQKQFANLKFDAPIDNLYNIVTKLPHRESLNVLFIQGLEKSLEPHIQPGYGGDGDYYNLDTVPTILGHLNQRREIFRDHFKNICFVFFLSEFAIKYIIRRAPDFYDWSAGVFDFPSDTIIRETTPISPRRQTVEKFTQFLDDRYHWQSDRQLKRNMQGLVRIYPNGDEVFWFNYFLTQVRERADSLASHHLQAYAEEICYISAKLVRAEFQDGSSLLEEYFQEARAIIGDGSKFWRNYDANLGYPGSYGQMKLYRILLENLFAARQDRPTSRYGLLVRVSKNRLEDALSSLPQAQLSQYLAVSTYLKEMQACLVRVRSVIQEPTLEQLGEIAQRYKTWSGVSLSPQQVKKILESCIDALYRQLPQQYISYDQLLDNSKGDRENDGEITEDDEVGEIEGDELELSIFQVADTSTIVDDLERESNDLVRESIVDDLVREAIASCDDVQKPLSPAWTTEKLLVLSYGFIGVNQELIGKILGVEQHQISRQLRKFRSYLIEKLVRFAKENPEINLDGEYINNLEEKIGDLLVWYYRDRLLSKEFKSDFHWAWNARGIALGKLRRYEEAITSYNEALEIKPDFHEAWFYRGIALGKLGRYEEAIASYNEALEIKPDFHEAWINRGVDLGKLGRYEEAIASYNEALEIYRKIGLREDEADTLKVLAELYQALGEIAIAQQYCQQALALATELGIPLEAECEALLLKIDGDGSI